MKKINLNGVGTSFLADTETSKTKELTIASSLDDMGELQDLEDILQPGVVIRLKTTNEIYIDTNNKIKAKEYKVESSILSDPYKGLNEIYLYLSLIRV